MRHIVADFTVRYEVAFDDDMTDNEIWDALADMWSGHHDELYDDLEWREDDTASM